MGVRDKNFKFLCCLPKISVHPLVRVYQKEQCYGSDKLRFPPLSHQINNKSSITEYFCLLTLRCSFVVYHPRKMGTNEMKTGHNHAAAIIPMAEQVFMKWSQSKGFTIAQNLSKDIAQRWRVLTVLACTSIEFQRSQTAGPKIHLEQTK